MVLPLGNLRVKKSASTLASNTGLNGQPSIIEKSWKSPTSVSRIRSSRASGV